MSDRNGSIFFVVFSIWVIAILGLYLSQFQDLIGPMMNVLKSVMSIE